MEAGLFLIAVWKTKRFHFWKKLIEIRKYDKKMTYIEQKTKEACIAAIHLVAVYFSVGEQFKYIKEIINYPYDSRSYLPLLIAFSETGIPFEEVFNSSPKIIQDALIEIDI